MGWEAVADFHLRPVDDRHTIKNWQENDKKSSQKNDDRVQQVSKKYIYPKSVDDFIADH